MVNSVVGGYAWKDAIRKDGHAVNYEYQTLKVGHPDAFHHFKSSFHDMKETKILEREPSRRRLLRSTMP
jgi:hypothetical protein